MVFTQLPDAENKLIPARTQIKYCMSLSVLFDLWFCCENFYDKPKNCYDKPNEIKFLGPQKWGIFIGKGVRLLNKFVFEHSRTKVKVTVVFLDKHFVITLAPLFIDGGVVGWCDGAG